jgi:hypothetical protein
MLFLTCYNTAFAPLGEISAKSVQRYIGKLGKHHAAVEQIPDDYDRKPSWYKVQAIRKHLKDHDFVASIDADAMIIGDWDMRPYLNPEPLNICYDVNGCNHGVAVWRNCPESFIALDLMEDLYPTVISHPWFEQAALMKFINILQHNALDKPTWNAYMDDRVAHSQILHLPGMRNAERLPIMQEEARKLGL